MELCLGLFVANVAMVHVDQDSINANGVTRIWRH